MLSRVIRPNRFKLDLLSQVSRLNHFACFLSTLLSQLTESSRLTGSNRIRSTTLSLDLLSRVIRSNRFKLDVCIGSNRLSSTIYWLELLPRATRSNNLKLELLSRVIRCVLAFAPDKRIDYGPMFLLSLFIGVYLGISTWPWATPYGRQSTASRTRVRSPPRCLK